MKQWSLLLFWVTLTLLNTLLTRTAFAFYYPALLNIYAHSLGPKHLYLDRQLWISHGFDLFARVSQVSSSSWELTPHPLENKKHPATVYISWINTKAHHSFKDKVSLWLREYTLLGYQPLDHALTSFPGSLSRELWKLSLVRKKDGSYWKQEVFDVDGQKEKMISIIYHSDDEATYRNLKENIKWITLQ